MIRISAAVSLVALLGLTACASTDSAPAPTAAAPAPKAAPAPAAPNPAIAVGEAAFNMRCSGCHVRGGAPKPDVLAGKGHAAIVESLTTGKMAAQGRALSDEEKSAVATFLTTKPAA